MNNTKEVMMKKYTVFFVLIIMAFAFSACGNTPEQVEEPQIVTTVVVEDQQVGNGNNSTSKGSGQGLEYSAVQSGTLTEEEAGGLLFMREEEKLAHDVYMALYELWGQPIFKNIAASEQVHTDTVKLLLNKYEIPDPAEVSPLGQFSDQDLQALYDQLVEIGSASLADALKVGTAVEEIDILDLEKYISQTELADITQVYENLLAGSQNHLRSFVTTLERQTGETFQPEYLSQEAYDEIISGSFETGRGGQMGGGKGNATPNN
jgi:hypothetical protein